MNLTTNTESENTMKIYRCELCGNIVMMLDDRQVVPHCCGQEMKLLEANTTDATVEKHVPMIIKDGCNVTVHVGETIHPMTDEHFIQFIILETDKSAYIRYLKSNDEPIVDFCLNDEKLLNVYEYCNIHGLWVKKNEEE